MSARNRPLQQVSSGSLSLQGVPARTIPLCHIGPEDHRAALEKIVNDFLSPGHVVLGRNGVFEVETKEWLGRMEEQTLQSICQLKIGSIELEKEPEPLFVDATELRSSTRPDTIRVMNIPPEWDMADLETELTKRFYAAPRVHSMARSTPCRPQGWRQHATVTFPALINSVMRDHLKDASSAKSPSSGLSYDAEFMQVTVLYDAAEDAQVDIIAMEGLGTNAFGTFRAPQGEDMWLRDYLPENIQKCRILLYGYNSEVPNSRSDQRLEEISTTAMNAIGQFRRLSDAANRPIIWIGQSMGGLVIQEILIRSKARETNSNASLFNSTIGFIGYGVPTNGLKNDSLLQAVQNQPNIALIRSICLQDNKPSQYLISLSERFEGCKSDIEIHYFYETNPSPDRWNPDAAPQRQVEDSEMIGRENRYFMPYNHSELVKMSHRGQATYITTVQIISLIMMEKRADRASISSPMFRSRSLGPRSPSRALHRNSSPDPRLLQPIIPTVSMPTEED